MPDAAKGGAARTVAECDLHLGRAPSATFRAGRQSSPSAAAFVCDDELPLRLGPIDPLQVIGPSSALQAHLRGVLRDIITTADRAARRSNARVRRGGGGGGVAPVETGWFKPKEGNSLYEALQSPVVDSREFRPGYRVALPSSIINSFLQPPSDNKEASTTPAAGVPLLSTRLEELSRPDPRRQRTKARLTPDDVRKPPSLDVALKLISSNRILETSAVLEEQAKHAAQVEFGVLVDRALADYAEHAQRLGSPRRSDGSIMAPSPKGQTMVFEKHLTAAATLDTINKSNAQRRRRLGRVTSPKRDPVGTEHDDGQSMVMLPPLRRFTNQPSSFSAMEPLKRSGLLASISGPLSVPGIYTPQV